MIITRKALSRRSLLRGAGAAVALPFLDAMAPALLRGQPAKPPVRMAFLYVPNGMEMRHWNPDYEGRLGPLPQTLQSLAALKEDFILAGNLTQNQGRRWPEGGGHHGRCCASYLTGVHPKKTLTDIRSSISFDQVMAGQIGHFTRFPSLELGIQEPRQAGECDEGYSCAYTNNLSWRSETQPMPPVLNPRDLFERLFGRNANLTPQERAAQSSLRRSILDLVMEDARAIRRQLGPTDQRKLDEYLTSIRAIENQIEHAEKENEAIHPEMDKPSGIPQDFAIHFQLMTDMITVAFQADLTRVITFLITPESNNRAYREIGIPDGHHALTHHRYVPELMEKVARINRYHVEQFAKWLPKLKAVKEADGSLLDHSMIVYGSGLADGNNHIHHDLPTLIAGRGGNYFKTGRRVVYRRETPLCNLFLTMMDRMGVAVEHFGDSTGRIEGLDLA